MLWNLDTLRGYSVRATDDTLGRVRDVLFDDQTFQVRYVTVDTGPWLFGRTVLLVPSVIGQPDAERRELAVRLSREQVKNSPPIEAGKPVERRLEEELHAHYGWDPYWAGAGALGVPAIGPELLAAELNVPRGATLAPGDPHLRSGRAIEGYGVAAADGDLGSVDSFLIDLKAWRVRYLVVDTGNWLPGRKVLVALGWVRDFDWSNCHVAVALPRERIAQSPEYDAAYPVDEAAERRFEGWYGTG